MTPDQYCQQKAARSGSSFYYSFLFLPPERRRAIIALYAFCREVDDVVDECSDAALARTKLAWWRQEVERLFQGQAQHPVAVALAHTVTRFDITADQLHEVIDGMEMDLEQSRYETFGELALYCHRVAGVVGLMAAEVFGYRNHQTQKYAHNLGLAFQLTNILRDVREDAMRGRVYLPAEELARFEVHPDELRRGQAGPRAIELFRFQADRAETYYERALELLPEEDRYDQRSGIIMAAIYRATLEEIRRDGFALLDHRVSLTPVRKLWIAWRTAIAEKRRQRRYLRRRPQVETGGRP